MSLHLKGWAIRKRKIIALHAVNFNNPVNKSFQDVV